MQTGKGRADFNGRYEMSLGGTLDCKPWTQAQEGGPKELQLRQYRRIEGVIDHPPQAVVRTVTVKVTDTRGAVLASHTLRM
jgi:hypothetical protein